METGPAGPSSAVGGVSAGASSRLLIDYSEPSRSQILTICSNEITGPLFSTLKVEVGSDVNSTDGSEPSHMRSRTDED
jgi:hypothetical protein